MRFNEDKRIKAAIPFLKEKSVLYIACMSSPYGYYDKDFFEEMHYRIEEFGYTLLHLQEVLSHLPKDMVHYMFPGIGGELKLEDAYQHIQEIAGLGDHGGFLYKQNAFTYFHPIKDSSLESIEESLSSLIDYLRDTQEPEYSDIRFGISGSDDEMFELDDLVSYSKPNEILFSKKKKVHQENKAAQKPRWAAITDEDDLDSKTISILDAWDEFERRFGITIKDLDVILGYRVKLSRLTISRQNVIQLIDWENSPVVKMDDVTKALYFFFLKHTEGAVLKELDQFRREILEIYMSISGREDVQGINETIDRLIGPYSDGRNTSMSRIRKAFKDIVGDRAAKFYYIDGKAGGTYTIHLDRDLVLWEH